MSVSIREACAEDYDAWYELRVAVAGEGRWIGAEPPIVRDEAMFVARLERDDAVSLVAEKHGAIVGSIGADVFGGVASLWMWVAATHRGQGIGRSLLQSVLEWAESKDAHKVTLEVWPHNGAAVNLYRSAGFEVEGRKVRHYRRRNGELWDALLMAKILDRSSPGSPYPDA